MFSFYKNLKKDEKKLVLLIALVVIAGFIYLIVSSVQFYQDRKLLQDQQDKLMYVFEEISSENVKQIKVFDRRDGSSIKITRTFDKEESTWDVSPKEFSISESSVEVFIISLMSIDYLERIESPSEEDLDLMGLIDPSIEVNLTGEDYEYTYYLGGQTFTKRNYYIKVNEVVYVVDYFSFIALNTRVNQFRALKVFTNIPIEKVKTISFVNNVDFIVNEFDVDSNTVVWRTNYIAERFYSPSSNAYQQLLSQIINFTAEDIVDVPQYETPHYSIEIESFSGDGKVEYHFVLNEDFNVDQKAILVDVINNKAFKVKLELLGTYFTTKPYLFSDDI